MRKLMALAIVVFAAGLSNTWALEKFSSDGSLEVSGVAANNETDLDNTDSDRRGVTLTRLRIGLNAQLTEGVMGRVEIDRTPDSAGAGASFTDDDGGNLNDEQSAWAINNAYVTLDNIWTMNAKVGRQYVGEANDLVWHIGVKSDDNLSINSIAGLDLNRSFLGEKLGVDLFTGKAVSSADADDIDAQNDTNVSNLSATLKDVIPTGVLNVGYLWGTKEGSETSDPTQLRLQIARIGFKGGVKENMLTYNAEYLKNMGADGSGDAEIKHKGTAIDLGAAVNLNELKVGKLSILANYIAASGDKEDDDSDKAFHDFNYLGVNTSDRYYGEIFGKSNLLAGNGAVNNDDKPIGNGVDTGLEGNGLNVINLGVKLVPSIADGKYAIKLDYLMFDTNVKGDGEESDIGTELDLALNYDHSANVGVNLGYAMFMPGDAASGGGINPDDNVTKMWAKLNVKWGGEEK